MMTRVLLAVSALVLLGAMWFARDDERAAPAAVASVTAPRAEPVTQATVVARTEAASAPAPQLASRALASAQTTVQSQLELLNDGQYDLFVQTFAPELRDRVTRDVFDACRTRVNQVPVRPDWETAERTPGAVSVSMFGKSLTTFEERDGRWLARSLWCVPVGLP